MTLKSDQDNKFYKDEIFAKIQKIISCQLGVEENIVTLESLLYSDLGGDALDGYELIMELEEEFDVSIADDELDELPLSRSKNTDSQNSPYYGKSNNRSSNSFLESLASISSLSAGNGYGDYAPNYVVKDIVDLICKKTREKAKSSQDNNSPSLSQKGLSKERKQSMVVKAEHQEDKIPSDTDQKQDQLSELIYKAVTEKIRKIQYQAAKIEVLESMCKLGDGVQSPASKKLYDELSIVRKKLFETAEECLNSDPECIQIYIPEVKKAITGANEFLLQVTSSVQSQESGTLFIKDLMTDIISELIKSNLFLSVPSLKPLNINSGGLVDASSEVISSDLEFQNLLRKCMGDVEKAERLINYEIQRSPGRGRNEAIQAAIIRWEMDCR
jgi:acyl carrier protein